MRPSPFFAGLALAASLLVASAGAGAAPARDVAASSTAVLRAKLGDLGPQFAHNAFGRPLVIESTDANHSLGGSVYGLLPDPYPTFQSALKVPSHWCDVLILHLNTKYCRAVPGPYGTVLQVNIGRKSDQPVEKSYRAEFAFRVIESSPEHFAVVLDAENGPFGTHDYRILLEAIPANPGHTFMHLAYSYSYGTAAKLGLMAYLSTAGSKKVGFTVTGYGADGRPVYIEGLRGLVERNTMRYFLAIEAFLGALSTPPPAQLEKRLADWYAAAEKYPRQLHEIGREEYLMMKRFEVARSQSPL